MSRSYVKVEQLAEEVFRRKGEETEEIRRNNELIELRMQVELLQNFLSEVGRR